ncbi:Ppx/GppA phosphatase family protein [Streptomyces sp. NPDC002574]|uniref:Ppx/GppA phosphatase family protein n=1 Tax=Streptomyces sp. NPDC002574 TaxID=3364652 RepID=UPI0036B62610
MRQAAVLDVGCHSALLTVVRRSEDGELEPVLSRKVRLGLHQSLGPEGRLRRSGVRTVEEAVAEVVAAYPRLRLPEVFAFATSVIRDAPNCEDVIDRVADSTGVRLRVLSGEEEARLAYAAARRWAGPGDGPLLVLDVGGGTVEIASGTGTRPRTVHSLPLGARTVTRKHLPGGTAPSEGHLAEVRKELRRYLGTVPGLPRAEPGGRVLACSKTFTQLARLAAARNGPARTAGRLTLPALRDAITLLAAASPQGRDKLPGISAHRAEQSLAGALVAEALMEACEADSVTICPWSTREGLLLERLGNPSTRRS